MNKPTEIDMGFRTITLAYKNQAELSLYELKLIDKYKQLHAKHKIFMNEISLFIKNKEQLRGYAKESKRIAQQILLKWNHIMELDTLYAKAKKGSKEDTKVQKLTNEFSKYLAQINDKGKRNKTMYDILSAQWDEIDKIDEQLTTLAGEFNALAKDFNEHPEKYELDNVQFAANIRADDILFKKTLEAWKKQRDEYDDLIDEYDAAGILAEQLNTSMGTYKSNHFIMHNTRPAATTTKTDSQVKGLKRYYYPKGHALIAQYEKELDVAAVIQKGLQVPITWAMVEAKDVTKPLEIICVAQHKTEWINNLVFGINFTFDDIPATEPILTNQHIMSNPKILAWMAKFAENPLWIFFLQSEGIRNGALSADLMLMQQTEVEYYHEQQMDKVGFKIEHLQIINDRLYNACIMFVEYCYATPVDTRSHINLLIQTGILSQLVTDDGEPFIKQHFTYEDVLAEWKKSFKH
ncbi:MAG: hypothetical protein ACYDCN_11435 [Bacteroidia bacterium]